MKQARKLASIVMAFVLAMGLSVPYAYAGQVVSARTSGLAGVVAGGVAAGDRVSDELNCVTGEAPLLQGGYFPQGSQLGSAWDGLEESASASGRGLSVQGIPNEDSLKEDILAGLRDFASTIDVSSFGYVLNENVTSDDLMNVYASVVNSHPDLFYAATAISISYYKDGRVCRVSSLSPEYAYSAQQVPSMRVDYETKMAELLSWVPEDASAVQQVKAAHDWIALNCEYDDYAAELSDPDIYWRGWTPWNAYGALVSGSAVCQGYALALRDAMNRLGIPCTYLSANGHAWNCVVVDDNWYHVDATWDDQGQTPDSVLSDYFAKSDAKVLSLDAQGNQLVHTGWADDIHATSTLYDDKSDWAVYTKALHPAPVTYYELSAETLNLMSGQTATLSPTNKIPATGRVKNVTWSTSNASVAAVDSAGKVTAGSKPGTATITCKLNNAERTCAVKVVGQITSNDVSLSGTQFTYSGSSIVPAVTVTSNSVRLTSGTHYTLTYANNVNAGTASVTVVGKGNYTGTVTKAFSIAKAANPLKVKTTKKKVKLAKVKKKAQKVKAISFKVKGQGKVTYAKLSKGSSKKLSVNKKTGKITVKKGTRKGTYKVKVKVKAAGNANYKSVKKTVTVTVKVVR